MKPLPKGNYALCIAHPGHEMRLHGFLEEVKPWIFILADEGKPSHMDRMQHYLGFIFKNTGILEKKRDAFYVIERKHKDLKDAQAQYVKDEEIQNELIQGNSTFFHFYVIKMANALVKDKIDHVVVDASEDMDSVHEINRIMTEIAIKLVKKKTGKHINLYEFNVLNPFDYNISDECIRIELSPEDQANKLKYLIGYHEDIFDELSQNISVDMNALKSYIGVEGGYEKIKNIILSANPDFFKFEYIRPIKFLESSLVYKFKTWMMEMYRYMIGKPIHSKDYNKVILPIKKKLKKLILNPAMVKKS